MSEIYARGKDYSLKKIQGIRTVEFAQATIPITLTDRQGSANVSMSTTIKYRSDCNYQAFLVHASLRNESENEVFGKFVDAYIDDGSYAGDTQGYLTATAYGTAEITGSIAATFIILEYYK